ncbi:unnamed protein product [Closterium sp. Yama58-4]|nr:unnamed protein product [Closterium sp. Yama58-4]
MLDRSGVRRVIEAVERQADLSGDGFELLISRLNTALRAYAKEERKRVRATMVHLQRSVAELKQAWLGDPGCTRLKKLLGEREAQLKSYQLVRQERLHVMAGLKEEVLGEVASPHLSAKIKARKGRTQITELNAGGLLVNDNEAILKAASQYYKELFGSDRQQAVSAWSPAPGRSLSQESAEAVCTAWSEEEVKAAFRSMAKDKAPGKDGLPKELFEFHWDILGKHFMKLVDNFAATATLPTSTKDAVTILLHKKGGREQLENYRPITLLSFTYKVIARVVADRMKRVLHEVISPEQYGFLPGRRLSDTVGLVADVIEAAKSKDHDWYLLLVDFRKAFDSVSRTFQFTVLDRMGFPSRLVDWVRGLHKDTRTSLLINGWMGEAVDVVSGVRQGCPLAPYLFLCAVEPLAQQAAARKLGLEKGERRLAYLGYADDTTLILQGEEQIAEAERLLADFEAESGLATNIGKSSILPLGCNLNKQACKTDGFKWVKADEAERLLGVWVTPAGSCAPTWKKAFARIKDKLRQWETQHLTTGARVAVINCYISPIIFFQAQVYPPPVDIWGRILKLAHNFVLGNHGVTDKKFILWSRDLLYTARADGDVGVRNPEIELTCLAARRIGLLLTETCELKRDIMLAAADLPLGTDTFVAHVKLLKCWRGKSERWKLACGSFMQSPLVDSLPALLKEEIAVERVVFNRNILLNGKAPVGGQKAAAKLWELGLGDLLLPDGAGGRKVKDVKTLTRELGGSKQAKLALRAWEAVPQPWKESLLSAEQLGPPPLLPRLQKSALFKDGQVASLKELKGCWKGQKRQSAKRELCPRIHQVVVAVKRSMRMLNPARQVSDLGDLLFGKAASASAFPEATLSAIAVRQIWAERCDCVFRGKRFRSRRVLRRIEAAFRLHVKVYTRAMGKKLGSGGGSKGQRRTHALAEQEDGLLGRIRCMTVKGWKWSHSFGALWSLARGALHPP